MSKQNHLIVITDARGFGRWLRNFVVHVLGMLALVAGPVGVGIVTGSAAMQWVGFVLGIVLLVSVNGKPNRFRTTDEARAYLDQIDRGEA